MSSTLSSSSKISILLISVSSVFVGAILGLSSFRGDVKRTLTTTQIIHHLIVSMLSSLSLGTFVISYLFASTHIFNGAELAGVAMLHEHSIGMVILCGCIFFICALPGWWAITLICMMNWSPFNILRTWATSQSQELVRKSLIHKVETELELKSEESKPKESESKHET